MKNKFKNILLLILLIYSIPYKVAASTSDESYIIQIPKQVIINNDHNFIIKIIENNLKENETLNIILDKNFVMKDLYGRQDVQGSINNNEIEISNLDKDDIEIKYEIDDLQAGKWSSDLKVKLSLSKPSVNHMLIDGTSLSSIFRQLQNDFGVNVFKKISFSNDTYETSYSDILGKAYLDVSINQDESVLLYRSSSTNFTITSNGGDKIYTNYDASSMFENVTSLTSIVNLDILDTSYTTNMKNMFAYCLKLTSLDVSSFDTSNVTNMANMFDSANKLKTLTGLSSLNTSKVTDMSRMFSDCLVLGQDIENVKTFDTSKVTDMSYMFADVGTNNTSHGISTLDLSNWKFNKVTSLKSMFDGSLLFASIIFPNQIDTSELMDMSYMFNNNNYLANINLSSFDTSKVNDMSYMFNMCKILVNTGNIDNWDTGNVKDVSYMFYGTWNIDISTTGSLNSWNISNDIKKENTFANSSKYLGHEPIWY